MRDFTITPAEAGQRLLHYISRLLPGAAMGLIRKSLRKKNILLNGKKAEGKEILAAGDVVRIFFSDETLTKFMGQPKEEPLQDKGKWGDFRKYVLYEDDQVLLLNKPAGLLSQGDGSGAASLNDGLLYYLRDSVTPGFKPSICNRLDRNTSGIVIAGKTVEVLQQLNEAIKERTFQKIYTAIVYGTLTGQQTLTGYLTKDHKTNQVHYSATSAEGAVPIETAYESLRTFTKNGVSLSLLTVHLITGRSHQIRVHLASLGHAILGDRKYGTHASIAASQTLHVHRQLLHSGELTFPQMQGSLSHLSHKTFHAPLPADMEKIISQ